MGDYSGKRPGDQLPAGERPDRNGTPDEIGRGGGRRVGRRTLLKAAGGLAAGGAVGYLLYRGASYDDPASTIGGPGGGPGGDGLDAFAASVRSGGPPKDGIPAIDEPTFVPATKAGFLGEDDIVFGVARGGDARAYPQSILVWHEIVNDRFGDEVVSVTYCPLTGSALGLRGQDPDGRPYTFGTSGNLVNSNLLMYDRQTDSRWPQILAQAITGPSRGHTLEVVPVEWTTWGRWRARFPDTAVLSTDTGYLRSYGSDPYGSYTPPSGYYTAEGLYFPVMREDDRFGPKDVVIGLVHGDARVAVPKSTVVDRRVVPARADGDPLVVLYDPDLDAARAFVSRVGATRLRLEPGSAPGRYVDPATGTTFDAWGRASRGRLAERDLTRVVTFDVMWFAWYAFFPGTEVIA